MGNFECKQTATAWKLIDESGLSVIDNRHYAVYNPDIDNLEKEIEVFIPDWLF